MLWSFYVSWRASRLDRLHNRTEAARTALDLALVRRASAAAELASSGQLDPATSLLLADAVRRRAAGRRGRARPGGKRPDPRAARHPRRPGVPRRAASGGRPGRRPGGQHGPASTARPAQAASDGAGDPDGDRTSTELLDEVEKAANQVFIARKFYNDVAGRTLDARRRPLARVLRLSGSARQPEFFEMDDALTDGE